MTSTDAAVWFRVSTGHQDSDNQVPDVETFASHHGYTITKRYTVSDSAWKNGGRRGVQEGAAAGAGRRARRQVLRADRLGA